MTMLSFRALKADADAATQWAERIGVDRSELLREALRLHLVRLASEIEATTWRDNPLTAAEQSLADVADWGPAEDWSDWAE